MALNLIRCSLSSANLNPLARYSHHAAHKFSHALQSSPSSDVTVLDNGIKVATEKTNSPTATVGVYVESGSRNEPKELNGITNFIEHLIFKGSKTRSKVQVEKDVYGLGAILNSFNNREHSGFFATLAPNDVPKAFELLSEMVTTPGLSEENIEEARKDILRELEECETNHEQIVMDYLHSVAYQETSLGFSKFGTTANVQRFTREDLERGFDLIFKGPQMVIAASGNVEHDNIVQMVQKGFSGVSSGFDKNDIPSLPGKRYTGSDIRVRDDSMSCAHIAFAIQGPGYNSPDYLPMEIASSLFGNWDLTHGGGINTACYMGMVSSSEHLAQSFQSFNLAYRDTALWGSYVVGERMKLEELLWQLQYQYKRLCSDVTNNEIRQGKNALLTKLITQREGSVNNAHSIASEIFRFGRRLTLEEWQSKISQVNSSNIHQVCEEHIWDRCPAVSAIGPVENFPNYEEIRMKMSWMRY
ncbi:mitochondrial processing peptidase beta subunit [Blomia tropicalis]|nr:mitochondrial processing peptidase beta subunit [Blomia tropicalis]